MKLEQIEQQLFDYANLHSKTDLSIWDIRKDVAKAIFDYIDKNIPVKNTHTKGEIDELMGLKIHQTECVEPTYHAGYTRGYDDAMREAKKRKSDDTPSNKE